MFVATSATDGLANSPIDYILVNLKTTLAKYSISKYPEFQNLDDALIREINLELDQMNPARRDRMLRVIAKFRPSNLLKDKGKLGKAVSGLDIDARVLAHPYGRLIFLHEFDHLKRNRWPDNPTFATLSSLIDVLFPSKPIGLDFIEEEKRAWRKIYRFLRETYSERDLLSLHQKQKKRVDEGIERVLKESELLEELSGKLSTSAIIRALEKLRDNPDLKNAVERYLISYFDTELLSEIERVLVKTEDEYLNLKVTRDQNTQLIVNLTRLTWLAGGTALLLFGLTQSDDNP